MALNKDDLVTAMIDGVKAYPDGGTDAMKALGKAIEDYLVENVTAKYSWVGVHSVSGVSDTTTQFTAELEASGEDFTCTPDDFNSFISELAKFLNGIKIKSPSDFNLTPLSSSVGIFTAKQLGKLEDEKDVEKTIKAAYGEIADGIINGIKSYFMAAATGTHGSYTGAATLTNVS